MTKTTQSSMMVNSPDIATDPGVDAAGEMTEKTAAELRTLCDEKGEPFDTALTEAQARERINALQDQG